MVMRALRRLRGALHATVRRTRVESDLDEELREYLEAATEQKIAAGMTPGDAARLARAEMGSTAAVKDRVRDAGWESIVESIWQDVRYALRALRRAPGFASVAILTFALGIGTNLAIFTLADGMLFRPLPFHDPDRLVLIQGYSTREGMAYSRVARIDFEQLRAHHSGFEAVATVSGEGGLTWSGSEGAESIRTSYGTPNLLELLGVGAHIGRPLRPGDEHAEPRLGMLTFDTWQRRFGGDPSIVGRTLAFDQARVEIVGVLPPRFIFPVQASLGDGDLFMVRELDPKDAANPTAGVWTPIARLKAGVSAAQAQTETDVLVRRTAQQFSLPQEDRALRVANLQFALFELNRSLLWLLISAAGGVLLIACVNLANLLLARGAAREREIGIRTAIGASRARVARQLLIESVVLGVLAGGVALFVAALTFDAAAVQIPSRYRLVQPVLDPRTVAFTLLLSVAASIVFGVLPALRLASANAGAAMRENRRVEGGRLPLMRAGAVLVAAQVALCFVLLAGTALTANSLVRRRTIDLGIAYKDVVQLRVALSTSRYATREQAFDFNQRVFDEVRQLPGVEAAAIDFSQFGGTAPWMHAVAEGIPYQTGVWGVTSGYFKTMGIPLVEGRDFSEAEIRADAPVAVVSESVARALWPGQRAEGKALAAEKLPALTVIGVARDVRSGYGRDIRPAVYRPLVRGRNRWMTIIARSAGRPGPLGQAMRTIVQRLDPRIVVATPMSVADTLARGIADQQFQTSLFALFGLVGLLVSVVGIYGVMAHWVSSRTREMGVRLALGAAPAELRRLVIRQASIPLAAGLAAGLLGAFVLTKRLQSLLYGVTPHDPATLSAVVLILLGVGIAAAYVPARRAARVDPIIALRAE
jgi:putative ABC transport system permease protein